LGTRRERVEAEQWDDIYTRYKFGQAILFQNKLKKIHLAAKQKLSISCILA